MAAAAHDVERAAAWAHEVEALRAAARASDEAIDSLVVQLDMVLVAWALKDASL